MDLVSKITVCETSRCESQAAVEFWSLRNERSCLLIDELLRANERVAARGGEPLGPVLVGAGRLGGAAWKGRAGGRNDFYTLSKLATLGLG